MHMFRLFLFLLLCLFSSALKAQIEDPEEAFDAMRRLEGTWFMATDRGDRLETWRIVDDSTMQGRGFRIRADNGDTVTLETIQLLLRDQKITYRVIARGQNNEQAIVFDLTSAYIDEFIFENPKHDDPQKIQYNLLGNREIQVKTEGKRGNRKVSNEYVFEREFTPAGVAFRVRGGVNAYNLRDNGRFSLDEGPDFSPRPGWELGLQFALQGRGAFFTLNFELNLIGKFAHANSRFTDFTDTSSINYVRDVTYNTTWLQLAFVPELALGRFNKLSVAVGPYYARQLFNSTSGTVEPGPDSKLFDTTNDFKRNDFGLLAGVLYKMNFGKKDLDGHLGLRANLGLADLDNLYIRSCNNSNLCNGRVSLSGVSLYYSMNISKF
jgi:Outer membrane protein beta-barrel domain/Domain of unknown function (DUF6265)